MMMLEFWNIKRGLLKTAVAFLEQALSGAPEISFLTIYYGLLNLAKITIIASGKGSQLRIQRHHGATWSGSQVFARGLLTDHITLQPRGTIPLLYQTLTGDQITRKRRVNLANIYPYIPSIGYELGLANQNHIDRFDFVDVNQNIGEGARGRLEIDFGKDLAPPRDQKGNYKLLSGFSLEGDKYVSPYVSGASDEEIGSKLDTKLRRFLLYDGLISKYATFGEPYEFSKIFATATPKSRSNLLLPEELPLFLAFFHLSNVVWYDPERLNHYFQSPLAGMLEALHRHGTYRYLILFWSSLNKKTIRVHS